MTVEGVPVSGIVVIDKPRGPSSHQVTAWVGKILRVPVGHAGTLDPAGSGVLVVMLGDAMRLAPYLQRGEKEYVCLWRLHGDILKARVEEVAQEFEGRIYQRPPKKAAVKRALRIRTVNRLEVLEMEGRSVLLRVACDAGTYIRSLCHHMGLAAGPGDRCGNSAGQGRDPSRRPMPIPSRSWRMPHMRRRRGIPPRFRR